MLPLLRNCLPVFDKICGITMNFVFFRYQKLYDYVASKSVSGSASNGLALWLSDKTVLKFADLSIYCQR